MRRRWIAGIVAGLLVPPAALGSGQLVAGASAASLPETSARWRTCEVTLDGVPLTVTKAERTRTVVNGTGGQRAKVGFYVRTDSACGFARILRTKAWVGVNGFTDGETRRQNTNTTPTGTYSMTETFGNHENPGTALPYHRVQDGDWWVQDNDSAYYNSLRNERLGGFRVTTEGENGSERLADFGRQYAHVVVINFNRAPDTQVRKRGSGIFLHVNSGDGATAGCVTIGKAKVKRLLSYLRSGDRITLVR